MMFKVPGKKQTQNQKNNSKTTNKLNPTKLLLKKTICSKQNILQNLFVLVKPSKQLIWKGNSV